MLFKHLNKNIHVYKENEELKKTIEETKSQQKASLSENQRKRPLSRFDYKNEYNENENVQYIVRKKRKTPKKSFMKKKKQIVKMMK